MSKDVQKKNRTERESTVYVSLTKNMIFPLNVMQPITNAKQRLLRCEVVFGLRDVDEADAVEQFGAVGFV